MKFSKLIFTVSLTSLLFSCASSYQSIQPKALNYKSSSVSENISLAYKYDLLDNKYAKKETRNNIKLVAIKVTNSSDQSIRFGDDVSLVYENGAKVPTFTNSQTFKFLKQQPATHLLYLLLTPVNLFTTTSSGPQLETKTTPIGLVIGPGLAGGNMIAASSANKKFKNDLYANEIDGTIIEPGKTAYGLIGIKSNTYDAIRLAFKAN